MERFILEFDWKWNQLPNKLESVQGNKIYPCYYGVWVWDGQSWNTKYEQIKNRAIYAIVAAPNDTVYACGDFTSTPNTPSQRFGRCSLASKYFQLSSGEHGSWFWNIIVGDSLSMNWKIYNFGVSESLHVSSVNISSSNFIISPQLRLPMQETGAIRLLQELTGRKEPLSEYRKRQKTR